MTPSHSGTKSAERSAPITLFLCGDVMTGRGIDQALPHPSDPVLYEPHVRDARQYVELAEDLNGPIPRPVGFDYIWGDALAELERRAPHARIVNLETSVTTSNDRWRGKGIHYRMHPGNLPCLTAAGIDCCVLANNHVLDWGYAGLAETVQSLREVDIGTAGAGGSMAEARAPARIDVPDGRRVWVFSFAAESSGVPDEWAAREGRPGMNRLPDLSEGTVREIKQQVRAVKRSGDIALASIHWGGNWGYGIPQRQVVFAHGLIDTAGIDIVHGHSSHHVKGFEVYRGKLVLYGCGDFLTDYEGISGHEHYRDDLGLMYFVRVAPDSGKLVGLEMVPTQILRFRLHRASESDRRWLLDVLNREGR
ncbi:MAG: poly-gamma-glutamate biosynthesis protein, partial [Pseudomonadales bacterium]|nr:CapA family protein [Pseudomonadales bacterium]NIX07366.1 poly-gamma-glutamate biosynthesis protein [Pseudomonadales bacterium]